MLRVTPILLVACTLVLAVLSKPTHIIHILADDLGWADVGYHSTNASAVEVITPNIDAAAAAGIELDRMYVHKICSPSRCSIQTGRAPIHVNVQNVPPEVSNSKDPEGGFQGIPVNMTGIATHLAAAGYHTHMVGKWDVGMATPAHSPEGRGYSSWLGYWHHANDYWSHDESKCDLVESMKDLWRFNKSCAPGEQCNGPATDLANGKDCSQSNQAPANQTCVYEELLLTHQVLKVLREHPQTEPLFLFWAMHLVHMPLQVPQAYLDKFAFVDDKYRRSMDAMVHYMDHQVGVVLTELKSLGLWDDSLIVFHSDNGGEIIFDGICGGNNWPLRGGKFSNFEGGIRVPGFVTGGAVPASRRGSKEEAYITGWDWYSTYAAIAGVDPTDHQAAAAGLPPIDSINQWPYLQGINTTSPRTQIFIGDTSTLTPNGDGDTLVGGLIDGDFKLVVGAKNKLYLIEQDTQTGPLWPNKSSSLVPSTKQRICGRDAAKNGCLFNIKADPTESHNLAAQMPDLFGLMLAKVDQKQKSVYSPVRGTKHGQACKMANSKYGGYWGPWINV